MTATVREAPSNKEFYRTKYGPVSRAFASLDANGQKQLRTELVQLWSAHNKASNGSTEVDAEYLEVVAVRDGNHTRTIRQVEEGGNQ